jgi:hypothetical protein
MTYGRAWSRTYACPGHVPRERRAATRATTLGRPLRLLGRMALTWVVGERDGDRGPAGSFTTELGVVQPGRHGDLPMRIKLPKFVQISDHLLLCQRNQTTQLTQYRPISCLDYKSLYARIVGNCVTWEIIQSKSRRAIEYSRHQQDSSGDTGFEIRANNALWRYFGRNYGS